MKRLTHLTVALGTVMLLVLLLALALGALPAVHAGGNIIKVPDDYLTIQAAIDAAAEGDEIWVKLGFYDGGLSISKGITLLGGWNDEFTARNVPTAIGSSLSPGDMNRVVAVTADMGWAAGDFGSIQRADDGGQNWSRPATGTGSYLYTISAADTQRAWAVGLSEQDGDPGWLLRTLDGQHWESRLSPVAASLSGISFVGARR